MEERRSENDSLSTYMWKKKEESKGKESKEGRKRQGQRDVKRVQKKIAHWDKQNNNILAPNCMLKV